MTTRMSSDDDERDDELVTFQQAADAWKVSPRTVRRVADTGEIPVVRVGERGVRLRRRDVRAYGERREC